MIHLKDMRAEVELHLETLENLTEEEIGLEAGKHLRMILVHLERMHRALAVHLEQLG